MKCVLMIGLLPEVVDLTPFPELTPAKLAAGLAAQEKQLCDLGFDARWCLVDLGVTAEAVAREALQQKAWDVVLVGAGVRTNPAYLVLFERLLNAAHELAPGARICFNTRPDDTRDAVLRWVSPPTASG